MARTLPSFPSLICLILPAMYSSRSSIRTSPALGATERASSIRLLRRSVSSRTSSRSTSSSSSSAQSSVSRTLHFSLMLIFAHALRRVETTSLSTNSTGISASLASKTAARSSAPGFSPVETPIRRCSAASAVCRMIIADFPSLIILRRSSESIDSGSVRDAILDSQSSTATTSGE